MDNNLWQQLSDMNLKYNRLEQENQRLKELLRKNQIPFEHNVQEQSPKSQEVTRRIEIFNNLFKGRTDVYAQRRENPNNPNGKASYYPVRDGVNSTNDYEQSESNHVKKAYKPLTNQTINKNTIPFCSHLLLYHNLGYKIKKVGGNDSEQMELF